MPMPVLSSAALLRLVLLAAPLDASALSAPSGCVSGTSHLELTEDTHGEAHAVCIHPGLSTSFLFDTKVERVELAGRERFRVMEDETGLALVPTRALTQGARVPMTVFFQDGMTPASARFLLVVHPSEAARQVEVTRQPRPPASCGEGEQQARAEARQCQEDKARLEARCSGQVGLLGLLAQGLLGADGIDSKDIGKSVTSRPGNTLTSSKARSYRSATARMEDGREVVRLSVELNLKNTGSTPWTLAGAVLVGPEGEEWKVLGAWQREPILPGKSGRIGVEVEMDEQEARGTFSLKLRSQEASGGGDFFDGVTFP
ncbi:MAG TPA: DUF2381 family protein [Archangium sp.]|uniref:DUF2381 family protein n=1 Tax=Archangium sp. TaxID=1872627 RepID=UPI002E2F7153|nr:DUF2381 family protein [Archangium sp.]HEX5750541.1 DUF2381 family protein [Archangium sp.]